MATQHERAGLGALFGSTVSPSTTPLTGAGVLNIPSLGTTCFLAVVGDSSKGNKTRRCKITCVTASRNIAWGTAAAGTATPAFTAYGAGAYTEGSLIMGGSGVSEWVSIPGNQDLWLSASATSTVAQLTCFEV